MRNLIVISKPGMQRESLDTILSALSSQSSAVSPQSSVLLRGPEAPLREPAMAEIGKLEYFNDVEGALGRIKELVNPLVLIDTTSDGINLLENLKRIKQQTPGTSILVLADVGMWQSLKKCTEVDGLLLKGFSAAQLISLISRMAAEGAGEDDQYPEHEPGSPLNRMGEGSDDE